MASPLMLAVVVVAGVMSTATAIFLRAKYAVQRTGTKDDGPSAPDLDRTAARKSDDPTADPQSRGASVSTASDLEKDASSSATSPTPPTPTNSPLAHGDDGDLEFTIEIAYEEEASTKEAIVAAALTTSPEATSAGQPVNAPVDVTTVTPAQPPPNGSSDAPKSAPPAEAIEPLQPADIFAKLFELALGQARRSSEITAGHNDVAAAVGLALESAATQDRYAPRRPNMLPRVLSASTDETFSPRELSALIARDPSLVGNLLKIANSSYYRITPEPVESVDRAVVLLGTDGIRSLVTAALMQPIFRIGGADFPRFPDIAWEHTFRSASASVPYNFLAEKSDPFAAELLSLVLGLAQIVIFRVALDQYAKNPRLRPDAGIVASLLDQHAASVAHRIATSWELSAPTLAGLDGQTIGKATYPTALGRSVYFGRVVGALAVLRVNRIIDDETGKASIPATTMLDSQVERMWTRLTYTTDKR